MAFSAGTVVLDVWPSLRGVQAAIQREAQGIGRTYEREMDASNRRIEKEAAKSGERTGGAFATAVRRQLEKSLGSFNVDADTAGANAKIAAFVAGAKELLDDLDAHIDVDAKGTLAEVRALERQAQAILGDSDLELDVRTNAGQARMELVALREQVQAMRGLTRDENRRRVADTKRANDELVASYRRLADQAGQQLARLKAQEVEATRRAGLTGRAEDRAAAAAAIRAYYEAEKDAAQAAARARAAAALRAETSEVISAEMVERAVKDSYDDQVDAARRAAAERVAISRMAAMSERAGANSGMFARFQASTIGQAANSMRIFNGYLLTAVTVGPLLIPILASLAAGFGGIAIAAFGAIAAIGILLAGFSGIGTTLQALAAVDKQKMKSPAASSGVSDTRQLRDAQVALARAREDSGQRIAAAARRQADAERALTDAVRDASRAQEDLVDARESAARQLEDMNNQLASGLLDEQLGAYRLEEAAVRLNVVLEDDQATAREKEIAKLEYEQEKQRYAEMKVANERLKVDVAEANAKGVEGSDLVVGAKERLEEAVRNVGDAEQSVADANLELQRAQVDEARNLADAEQRVRDAIIDLKNQAIDAGVAGSAAFDNLAYSMSQLSPAGQAFATFLWGLKPLLDTIQAAAQSGLLPGLQSMIQTLVNEYGDDIINLVGTLAKVMGDLFVIAGEQLTSPWWREFFDTMMKTLPVVLPLIGQLIGSFITIFAGIMQAFAPYADEIIGFFLGIAQGIADWAQGLADSEGFATFMDYIAETAPKVARLVGLMLTALVKLATGLAPYADKLVDLMIGVFGWLAEQSPDTLAKWALVIMAIVGAFQALAGAMSLLAGAATLLFGGGGGLLSLLGIGGGAAAAGAGAAGGTAAAGAGVAAGVAAGPPGWVILAIVGIGLVTAAIITLYNTSEGFKEFWDGLWNGIGKLVSDIGQGIQDAVGAMGDAIAWVWNNVIAPPIDWVWQNIIKPVADFIIGAWNILAQVIGTVGNIIYQIVTFVIGAAWTWLYEEVIDPVVNAIATAWNWLYTDVIKPVWENFLQPVFAAIGNFINDKVVPAFQTAVNAIAMAWGTIVDIAKIPVAFVVETVINKGIIDNFNRLADIFPGLNPVDHIQLPSGWDTKIDIPQIGSGKAATPGIKSGGPNNAYADGGVLPGYTPGRDVHHFTSPTGGRLSLSGGEAIMVPEWTRLMGGEKAVAAMNRKARRGYADGGVLGWLGDRWDDVTDAIGGVVSNTAALLRDPAGYLRDLVHRLVGDDNKGVAGLAAGMALKVVDAVAALLGANAPASETGAPAPAGSGAIGWKAMSAIIGDAFPSLRITSGYRPGAMTATGQPSMHAFGRAVDIAPPSMNLFNWLNANYPGSQQILYSPAGARQIVWNGRRGDTSGITKAQHYNHVHWAMKDGGVMPLLYDDGGALPPGLSLVMNRTQKPEQVLTGAQFEQVKSGGDRVYNFEVEHMGADAREVAEELERMRRDALAVAGIEEIGVSLP